MKFSEKLQLLPLFQGMSSSELDDVVTMVKFGFETYSKGRLIVEEGMPVKRLLLLMEGELTVSKSYNGWSVEETIQAPAVIQCERLFGMRQHYSHSFTSRVKSNILSISKSDLINLVGRFLIFRINLLNLVSQSSQLLSNVIFTDSETSLCGQIKQFFRQHSLFPYGHKVFKITMNSLALELNVSRLEVSNALRQLADEGYLVSQRGLITVREL